MAAAVLYMSTSLDGFIAGPNEGPDNGLGDGGLRLNEWLMTDGDIDLDAIRRSGGGNGRIVDEFMSTGSQESRVLPAANDRPLRPACLARLEAGVRLHRHFRRSLR